MLFGRQVELVAVALVMVHNFLDIVLLAMIICHSSVGGASWGRVWDLGVLGGSLFCPFKMGNLTLSLYWNSVNISVGLFSTGVVAIDFGSYGRMSSATWVSTSPCDILLCLITLSLQSDSKGQHRQIYLKFPFECMCRWWHQRFNSFEKDALQLLHG